MSRAAGVAQLVRARSCNKRGSKGSNPSGPRLIAMQPARVVHVLSDQTTYLGGHDASTPTADRRLVHRSPRSIGLALIRRKASDRSAPFTGALPPTDNSGCSLDRAGSSTQVAAAKSGRLQDGVRALRARCTYGHRASPRDDTGGTPRALDELAVDRPGTAEARESRRAIEEARSSRSGDLEPRDDR